MGNGWSKPRRIGRKKWPRTHLEVPQSPPGPLDVWARPWRTNASTAARYLWPCVQVMLGPWVEFSKNQPTIWGWLIPRDITNLWWFWGWCLFLAFPHWGVFHCHGMFNWGYDVILLNQPQTGQTFSQMISGFDNRPIKFSGRRCCSSAAAAFSTPFWRWWSSSSGGVWIPFFDSPNWMGHGPLQLNSNHAAIGKARNDNGHQGLLVPLPQ